MKNIHRRFSVISLFLLLGLLFLAGCQAKSTPQESLATFTPTLDAETPAVVENQYPSTPEEVIRAFLITYPADQINAIQYLSPSLVSKLDTESVSKLLPASGEITGFIIEKGGASAEAEESEILANIAFQETSREVEFKLEIVDGRWVIKQIIAK